jgi:LytS/YehU family sensor histidine kinase
MPSPSSASAREHARLEVMEGIMITSFVDATLTESAPRRSVVRTVLFWIGLAAVATAACALSVVDWPSARVPGVRWWVIWLIAAYRGLTVTLWLYVTFWVTERFPIGRDDFRRRLGVHTLAALVLAAQSTLQLYWYTRLTPLADPRLREVGWGYFFGELLAYAILASLAHALAYAKQYWQIRGTSQRLRAELAAAGRRRAAAELRALKAEINPHFLGNALDAVSGLVRTDPAAGERVLAELGDLLRVALMRSQTQEVPLREELEVLEPFLDIERARLGWRFEVALDVGEEALGAFVPHMILQPMVENAVRRGLGHFRSGRIRISARRIGRHRELLELTVADEGAGPQTLSMPPMAPATAAAWVANARARLGELYGHRASLELSNGAMTSAAAARLTIPWQEADTDALTQEETNPVAAVVDTIEEGDLRATWWRRLRVAPIVSLLVFWAVLTSPHLKRPLPDGTFVPVPLQHAIPAAFVAAAIMVGIGCMAFRLVRRYPVVSGSGAAGRTLLAHTKAALTLGALGSALRLANSWAVGYLYDSLAQIRPVKAVASAIGTMALYVLWYMFLAVVAHGTEYARRYRQARAAARRLRAELAEVGRRRATAELCALKAELNPHFLGNALHTVSALVHTDPDAAERVLTHLRALLRAAVARSRTQEVPLREELETLEPFLAVAQARLGQQLEVKWDVDEALLDARVPHMILQPLVENAVKHGLAPRRAIGHIEVAARRGADRLELWVRDDGVGLVGNGHPSANARRGLGLANTRARLAELYGSSATLELMSGDKGGTVARLSVPWRDGAAPLMQQSFAAPEP